MRAISFLSAMLLLLMSCNTKRVVYYTYNHVTITRVDFDGATNFYYGYLDCKQKKVTDTNCVHAEYYGFNNGMDIYLVFKNDSTVEIINYGVDHLNKMGVFGNIKIGDYGNDKLSKIIDKYKKQGLAMIRLSDYIKQEKEFPDNVGTKVVAQYD